MTAARFLTLAQAGAESFQTTEYDLPESTVGILLLLIGLTVLFGLTIRTSLRDSRFLKPSWRATLLLLRTLALMLVLLVLLNPRERTQKTQVQRSRVGVLVDTSLSMAYPVEESDVDEESIETRSEAIQKSLVGSGLIDRLSETHSISVHTFNSSLSAAKAVVSDGRTSFVDDPKSVVTDNVARVDLQENTEFTAAEISEHWRQLLQPVGAETRLGQSLHEMIGQLTGRTLAGIVVLTDGRSNAGLDPEIARLRAERSETKLVMVGVGSDKPQVNVWVAGMQSPSDVHRGDPFDVSVTVQGSGLYEQGGTIELFQQSSGSNGRDRKKVAEADFKFEVDGVPAEVRFEQQLTVPGKYEYVAVAKLGDETLRELSSDDNQRQREVEVTDRKQKVLVISSGPMRDYQFVRNTLYRHSGIDSDVWLQTVTEDNLGFVTQEAENLLTAFPKSEAELFEYDVIIAFDADWSLLSGGQQKFLNRWVDEHSGGIIFVAGELFTPELARDADKYRDVSVLYPVVLNRMLAELKITQRADTPWPVVLTPEGRASQFLKIADASGKTDVDLWKKFTGIYRSYPVKAVRDGAVVLAKYGNPRARTQQGQPPFLATQFYGKGRTMFVSSAETWRLRSISAEGHQRFWTGLIRDVGQGRRSRGRSRGLLLLDRSELSPGQTVTIRAQLYDSRMQALQRESVSLSIVDAEGRPVNVPGVLRGDVRRTGQFVNTFRPARQGQYRISVPVPESSDVLQATIEVVLPNLESENPSQDVQLLTSLTENKVGAYLSLADMSSGLEALLSDRSGSIIVDEQLRTLWDRRWVMFLIAGLLAVEWALRRIARLS